MRLIKKVQVRTWSHLPLQSLNHDPLKQSSDRLCHGTKMSCLGARTRFVIKNSCLLSQRPSREHYIIYCYGVSCQTSVSMFWHCPCYRSTFNTLQWNKDDDLWADQSILSMSIFGDGGARFEPAWYFYEHGSETCPGKRPEPQPNSLFVKVWLWSKRSGVETDTLTLFRWF